MGLQELEEDFKIPWVSNIKDLSKKIRKSKKNKVEGEKPAPVKTHYRNMVVVPEMIGAVIAVYNGKEFMPIEMKFHMIGKYLGEFAMSYKPTRHGKPGLEQQKDPLILPKH